MGFLKILMRYKNIINHLNRSSDHFILFMHRQNHGVLPLIINYYIYFSVFLIESFVFINTIT